MLNLFKNTSVTPCAKIEMKFLRRKKKPAGLVKIQTNILRRAVYTSIAKTAGLRELPSFTSIFV